MTHFTTHTHHPAPAHHPGFGGLSHPNIIHTNNYHAPTLSHLGNHAPTLSHLVNHAPTLSHHGNHAPTLSHRGNWSDGLRTWARQQATTTLPRGYLGGGALNQTIHELNAGVHSALNHHPSVTNALKNCVSSGAAGAVIGGARCGLPCAGIGAVEGCATGAITSIVNSSLNN